MQEDKSKRPTASVGMKILRYKASAGQMSVGQNDESTIDFMKETTEPFLFTDREGILIMQILGLTLHSEVGRQMVACRFGEEYLLNGEMVLKQMGGKDSRRSFPGSGKLVEPERVSTSIEERRKRTRKACTILADYAFQGQAYKDFILNISHGDALLATSRRFLVVKHSNWLSDIPIEKKLQNYRRNCLGRGARNWVKI